MNSIILAKGEKSKRLGFDKAFIEISGVKLIEMIIRKISPIFKKIYVVSVYPDKFENYRDKKVEILKDEIKCGPIGGIYTGLIGSDSLYNFVFAIDMPFLDVKLLKYMMKIEKNYDVLLPKTKDYIQVLCGIYSKNITGVIKKNIENKDFKILDILKNLNVKFIEENEIKKFGKPEILFFNLNTVKDIEKAEHIWEGFFYL